ASYLGLTVQSIKYNGCLSNSTTFREGSMRATFSYASILHAVGQVLDQLGVRSIAIHEEEDGLFVEGFNSSGQLQVQLRYDIAGLYDLLCQAESLVEEPGERESEEIEGTLRRFLTDHNRELIGASL
ncbi:MAG TPA: hypothetical protein VKV19_04915, partial [Ktedonobacteraceae bacterium]|nr:hypothetical protein [Ktedonobacteraceae bacterium]